MYAHKGHTSTQHALTPPSRARTQGVSFCAIFRPYDLSELPEFITRIRSFVSAPLAVGFGISTREHFDAVAHMDGVHAVVVGSKLIKTLQAAPKGKSYSKLFADIVTRL